MISAIKIKSQIWISNFQSYIVISSTSTETEMNLTGIFSINNLRKQQKSVN